MSLLFVFLAIRGRGCRRVPVEAIGDHGIPHQTLYQGSIAKVRLCFARALNIYM